MERPVPVLTVAIPTYRRPAMLRRAIESVVSQQYPRTVVCVYDNGNDPATAAVVAEFAGRSVPVQYHAHQRNIGANENFIYALDHIESEYYVALSDDDLLLPGSLARGMTALAAHPEALFVASPVMLVDPGGRVLKVESCWPPDLYERPRGLIEMAARGHFMWTGALFRRRALQLVGNLDLGTGMLSDMDFLFRVAARGAFLTIAEPGAVFGWHPLSTSSLPDLSQFWPGWSLIAAKLRADPELPTVIRAGVADRLERRLAGKLFLVGLFSSSRGRTEDARACADLLAQPYRRPAAAALVRAISGLAAQSALVRAGLVWLAGELRWPSRRAMRVAQARFDREFRSLFELALRSGPIAGGRKNSAA